LDFGWDAEHIEPATRLAALWAQWLHVWRPALALARSRSGTGNGSVNANGGQGGNSAALQQLLILRQLDYARFVTK
jgi:hypothetical protein